MNEELIELKVFFFSYFKDLTGCESTVLQMKSESTLSQALEVLRQQYPKLEQMKSSTLVAVGLEYMPPEYVLQAGEEISLFPPVQGG